MSLSATRLQPNPTAGPLTAATTGIRHRAIPSTISRPSRMVLARRSGSLDSSSRYPKSPPAENARPAPVITAARAVGSSVSRCQSRASPTCRLSLTELSESGRFKVMIRSGPSARTSTSAGMSYTSDSFYGRDPLHPGFARVRDHSFYGRDPLHPGFARVRDHSFYGRDPLHPGFARVRDHSYYGRDPRHPGFARVRDHSYYGRDPLHPGFARVRDHSYIPKIREAMMFFCICDVPPITLC